MLLLPLAGGCSTPDVTQYGFSTRPEVFWRSEFPRWDDANEQAYLTSLAFSETMGLEFEQDFFVYVLDKPEDSPNYGEYQGYRSPGRIHIYLKVYRSTFAQTALCHELLHQYEHEVLGISYSEALPNFTSKNPDIHFTTFSMDEAKLIIRECENRALSYILDAPGARGCELAWTNQEECYGESK